MANELSPLKRLQNTRMAIDSDDRRSLYRVARVSLETVRVVAIRHGLRIPVLLLDVSATGCAVCVPTDQLPRLREVADGSGPHGWTVGIWMPELERPLAVPATARYLTPMPGGVRVGFGFVLHPETSGDLHERLQVHFNQRRAVRARPPTHESIPVEVDGADGRSGATGLLRDLSLMGVGVLVGADDGAALGVGREVRVSLTLPGGESLDLAAIVRHREELGLPAAAAEFGAPATHLGIEFSASAVRAARVTNIIGGFIVEQQMRTLREAEETRKPGEERER